MHIFLISGKAQSGKDQFYQTAKKYLNDRYMLRRVARFAYGDAVKKVAIQSFGWDGRKDTRGRGLLQLIGDGARAYNPNIWIERTIKEITDMYDRGAIGDTSVLFITDCRYPNEIEEVKEYFEDNPGIIIKSIRIVRPLDFDNGLTPEQKQNSSETALDDYTKFDYTIANIHTLKEYEANVIEVLKREGF